jgi:DNA-binding winged helix-turn-helix (wHTH) protein
VEKKSSTKQLAKSSGKKSGKAPEKATAVVHSWLQLGQLRFEKCELKEAQVAFSMALAQAKRIKNLRAIMEALAGLLRISTDALDEPEITKWHSELEELMKAYPTETPATAWYCKAVLARHRSQFVVAQRFAHEYILTVEREALKSEAGIETFGVTKEEALARGWSLVATILFQRGRTRRAQWLAQHLLERYKDPAQSVKGIVGIASMVMGSIHHRLHQYDEAMECYQKAHESFLTEHNWYFHLFALIGYATVHRAQQNYAQAAWYLNLVDKAASGREFGVLRRAMALERAKVEQDAVDLVIDSRKGVIKTRETGQISLRKQYVLLHILEALSKAHSYDGSDMDRGLSKAEIIQSVWDQPYRPEAHDNKLYYNINRLRKLIEPDIRKPQYVLNWKEGYRLAPGLRIQFIGGSKKVTEFEGEM